MIRKYTFIHSENSKLFLTSDTHFCHSKLVEQRGFKSIEEHDETLISNWNSVVRPQDSICHLGDFVLGAGDKSKEVCINLFNRLNGHITLLFGNHLAGVKSIYQECVQSQHNLDPETYEVYPVTWNNKVTFVGNSILAHVKTPDAEKSKKQNHFVFCSHYAHRLWIDSNKETLHASAHSHSSDKESNPDWKFNKRLDVGVDNFNFTPISFDKFLEIMDTKTQPVIDHHNKNINPSF
jgi:calcineurin-like phosphoesterase family protein